jgi:hypothetical protein
MVSRTRKKSGEYNSYWLESERGPDNFSLSRRPAQSESSKDLLY